ncbi:methyltransferase type 11 [Methanocaldococcus villosus KIN24-T80]|uniref:Methyltransferase type 11 n=1 Tax=Methanocaldococcus villosus KIN24-T80 TaxID=1069083 RepID=N6VYM3_9EURY|nr:class I SAM-dependent methyltransferase [Methanocaldococcus villosus]ENN96227.1 methyltransferase type 11 [Methanocaldococcus villosus KIN24-T80]
MWECYAKKVPYFLDLSIPDMLKNLLKELNKRRTYSLIDLGCGDGRFLYALYKQGLLKNATRVVGVDISEERIRRLKKLCPFAEGIVADVTDLSQIPDNSFDVAISNQVIEHVPDDSKMLKEIRKILKPNGLLYISTVIKKWYGFWIYWKNGFKLDPTHVREYMSEEEFLNLLENNGFMVKEFKTSPIRYPIMDLILRGLIKLNIIKPDPAFYQKYKLISKLKKLKLKVIGYKSIEVVAEVKK